MSKKKKKHYFREKLPTRPCPITIAGIEEIDYKDVELLKMFITDNGKIIPRRISGLSSRSQKKVTRAIKQARNAALLSFSAGYITQDEIQE
jgi:small subunit ribosomal protein S18